MNVRNRLSIKLTDPGLHPEEWTNVNLDFIFELLKRHNASYTKAVIRQKDDDNNNITVFQATREIGEYEWKCKFYSDQYF